MKLQIVDSTPENLDVTRRGDIFIKYHTIGTTYTLEPIVGTIYTLTIFIPKDASIEEKLSEIFNQKVEVIGL